jgi:molybdate transport system substrate-binding protein
MQNLIRYFRHLLFLAFFPVASAVSTPLMAGQIAIAVTNDFDFTLDELKREFERISDHQITIIPGPSSRHYGEIINGANFDIFLSDDAQRPVVLEQEQKIIPGSRFTYAISRLVLWSLDNRALTPEVLQEQNFHLLALTNPRLSACDDARDRADNARREVRDEARDEVRDSIGSKNESSESDD